MKIALIGNMNNSNFAILRYLRDMGLDAHLLLMVNDGAGHSSHFKPEFDTFEYEKWKQFIHQTSISEDLVSSFNFPISWLLAIRSLLRSFFDETIVYCPPISRKQLAKELRGYDLRIGSGIMPATLRRIHLNLDIFYPYAIGVEYVGESIFKAKKKYGLVARALLNNVEKRQISAIRSAKIVINAERSITESVLQKIGVCSHALLYPMLYAKEAAVKKLDACNLNMETKKSICQFSVISHARLLWCRRPEYSEVEWLEQNKNNDRLIHAFAKLVRERSHLNPQLHLFEYGPDIGPTKELADELGISSSLCWHPKVERRKILEMIRRADIGVGEFYDLPGILWGGTAAEIMACGRPVIQGFSYSPDEFEGIFGAKLPPVLAANTEEEIFNHLLYMADHPEERRILGNKSKDWFDRYNGLGLMRQWVKLLFSPGDKGVH